MVSVTDLTFPVLIERLAKANGGIVAHSFEGRRTTFAALERRSSELARALIARGVTPGTRIGYLARNSDRFFELMIAAAKAGAVLVPIGWRLAAPEIRFMLDNAEIAITFTDAATRPLCESAYEGGDGAAIVDFESYGGATYDELRGLGAASDVALPPVAPDTVFLQLYTSGTTGRPKGVTIAHRNFFGLRAKTNGSSSWADWLPGDIALVATPLSHIGAVGWGMLALYNGVTAVIAREFDPAAMLDFIEHDGVNRFFTVPAALRILLDHPRVRDANTSRLRSIVYGASPIPLGLLREAVAVFGDVFVQTYGMTEATGTVTELLAGDHCAEGSSRMRSAGRAVPGVELRVVDADGTARASGEIGEVVVRCAGVMAGYWRQPDATAAAIDADGWLRTGDAGHVDADGYLFVHDRVKDMIISGGENVYPAEVENAMYDHPDITEVAVIGVPDERWGEAVKAIVVLRIGVEPDPAAIIAFAQTRIARFKAPKSIDFVAALPRNASGKVLRRALREPYWAGRERAI